MENKNVKGVIYLGEKNLTIKYSAGIELGIGKSIFSGERKKLSEEYNYVYVDILIWSGDKTTLAQERVKNNKKIRHIPRIHIAKLFSTEDFPEILLYCGIGANYPASEEEEKAIRRMIVHRIFGVKSMYLKLGDNFIKGNKFKDISLEDFEKEITKDKKARKLIKKEFKNHTLKSKNLKSFQEYTIVKGENNYFEGKLGEKPT